jgi:Ca2+-binding EF-hand superfamily protein
VCPCGRAGTGYIRVEDLRRILHNLGAALPNWLVKELTTNVADTSSRHRADRVYYRDLTDKEVV